MGRKPKYGDNATEMIRFSLTPDQVATVYQAASLAGVDVNKRGAVINFLRNLALSRSTSIVSIFEQTKAEKKHG